MVCRGCAINARSNAQGPHDVTLDARGCRPVLPAPAGALYSVLDKAAAHAAAKKIDPAALLVARLFPDMFPLTRQVQLTCDFAKNTAARLAGGAAEMGGRGDDLRRAQGADREDHRVRQGLQAGADRRGGAPATSRSRSRAEPTTFKGQRLPPELRAAELLLPRHRGLRRPAPHGVEVGKRDYLGRSVTACLGGSRRGIAPWRGLR